MAAQELKPTRHPRRCVMPCVLMRAGTSKGLFIHSSALPSSQEEWAPHLISALGSRRNDPRQIDGLGGGTSTTSKVAVVSPSTRDDADVEWTFVQVAVGKESVDFSGTCGNMVSGVGPFAVQEGMVKPEPGQTVMDVRVYNTNTRQVVVETVEIDEMGEYREDGDYSIPGVSATGSEVKCAFVEPEGSVTGRLFPSGEKQQVLRVHPTSDQQETQPFDVRVSLVDAANPFVLIDTTSISQILNTLPSPEAQHALVEDIRRDGAIAMGLAKTHEEAGRTRGTPKAALLYPPVFSGDGKQDTPDIRVQSYSMGLPHPSLQLTGAVCLASAVSVPGTIAADLSTQAVISDGAPLTPERTPSPTGDSKKAELGLSKHVIIAHSKGSVHVDVAMTEAGGIASCAVSRTARRLFEGNARYYVDES